MSKYNICLILIILMLIFLIFQYNELKINKDEIIGNYINDIDLLKSINDELLVVLNDNYIEKNRLLIISGKYIDSIDIAHKLRLDYLEGYFSNISKNITSLKDSEMYQNTSGNEVLTEIKSEVLLLDNFFSYIYETNTDRKSWYNNFFKNKNNYRESLYKYFLNIDSQK